MLTHDHPFLHWDLMLEQNGVLRTWRLHREPDAAGPIVAEPLPDHRLAYLDYEGEVSGGRGHVARVEAGACEITVCDDQRWVVEFVGAVWRGRFQWDPATGRWQRVAELP